MKTRNLVTWLSPLAVAVLAFGSQIALAQETSTLTRDEVRAEALQAQKSGALERQHVTSYNTTPNQGPNAPVHTSQRAVASQPTAPRAGGSTEVQATKNAGSRAHDPV